MARTILISFFMLTACFANAQQVAGAGPDSVNHSTASVQQVTNTATTFWLYQSGQNINIATTTPPASNIMVDVYDVAGRLVFRTNWDHYQTTKNLGDFGYSGGIYIIKLNENNLYHVLKWVKG